MKRVAAVLGFLALAGSAAAVPGGWTVIGGIQVVHFFAGGAGVETIPSGASQLIIETWAGGGAGSRSTGAPEPNCGGSGASGGYARKTIALTSANWGQTLDWTVGASASASVVANDTLSTGVAIGGGAGGAGNSISAGVGAAPAGGDINTAGHPGVIGCGAAGGAPIPGLAGAGFGAGGASAPSGGFPGSAGYGGAVSFSYS